MLSCKEANGLTLSTAGKGVQLSRLSLDRGESGAAKLIAGLLKEAITYVPYNRENITNELIVNYSLRLVSEFWSWKYEDLILMLRKGTGGEYGKNYHAFTWATLMEWMEKYHNEKQDFLHHEHLNKKTGDTEFVEPVKKSVAVEEFTKLREALQKSTVTPIKKEATKETNEPADPAKEFFALFDRLHYANGIVRSGIRFCIIEGQEYDQETFVSMKLKEIK